MLRSLEMLQNGLINSKSFEYAINFDRIFDLELSNHCRLEEFYSGGINSLDIDKIEERYLISSAKDGSICIHDLLNTTGKMCFFSKVVCSVPRGSSHAHRFSCDTVQWYPFDTGMFVSSGMDHKLKVWDTNTLKPVEVRNMQFKVLCHHMSNVATQHSLIAVAVQHPHAILLDPRSGAGTHELRAHRGHVTCVRWSTSTEYLIATGGTDNKIFLWDIRSAKGYLRTLDQHNGEAKGNKKDLVTAHDGVINSLRFTDDGLHMVSYGTDCRLRLWDVAFCRNTLVNFGLVVNNSDYRQRGMALCCDTNPPTVFVPTSNYIYVYDLFTGLRMKALVGHYSFVNCCVYRSSTQQLYSGGNDMNILLWTPDVEREILEDKSLGKPVEQDNRRPASPGSDMWSDEESSS